MRFAFCAHNMEASRGHFEARANSGYNTGDQGTRFAAARNSLGETKHREEETMYSLKLSVAFLGFACLFYVKPLHAALQGTTTRVASGLSLPLFATFAPGDTNHLFVLEQGGNIKIVDLNAKTALATPFLHIGDTDAVNEGRLLGLAFH